MLSTLEKRFVLMLKHNGSTAYLSHESYSPIYGLTSDIS
jgi:hypothetical protein